MCWKYEDLYPGGCTDFIFFGREHTDAGVLNNLEMYVGAKIDYEKARPGLEKLMSEWHETGVMVPEKNQEVEYCEKCFYGRFKKDKK